MDTTVLKVAVDTQYGRQLYNFNQSVSLKNIIIELSKNSPDAETMALVWVDSAMYLNENNRSKVINGALLKLTNDPKYEVNNLLASLRQNANNQVYTKMAEIVKDGTMAEIFVKGNGLEIVVDVIYKGKCNDFQFDKAISALLEILDTKIAWEKTVTLQLLNHIVMRLQSLPIHKELDLHSSTLAFLENAISMSEKTYQTLCSVPFTTKDVKRQINMSHNPTIQAHALAVVNAFLIRTPQLDNVTFKEIRQSVLNNIIRSTNNASSEVSRQLYVLQVLFLNKLTTRMTQKPNPNDRNLKENILELARLAFENLAEFPPASRRTASSSSVGDPSDIKNLGFSNNNNPILDFSQTPPGLLALDCMQYFANTHQNDYIRLVLENSSSSAKSYQRPFAKSSIALVKSLCEIFKLGEPPVENCITFQPLLFAHDHIFQEIFYIGIMQLNKTWKDMNAINEDFDKVLSVVREQIEIAMDSKPSSADQFKSKIPPFQEILKIRQSDSHAKEKFMAKAKPVVELQERVKSELILLIEEQRTRCLMDGSPFQRIMITNKKFRNKTQWFCRLSSNKRYLHHGDYDERKATLDDLPNKIDILEIVEVHYGKNCPYIKNMKAVRKGFSPTMAISIQYGPEDFLNLIAADTETFNIWMDGLSKITGGNIQSDLVKSDMDMLLSMEMKLRLLDIETLVIPDQPPPLPPLPDNLNFAT